MWPLEMIETLASIIPNPDFHERHAIFIATKPTNVWQALKEMNLDDSKLIRILFLLRGLRFRKNINVEFPLWSTGWNRLFSGGFEPIRIEENQIILMRLNNKILRNRQEQINIAWNFILTPIENGTILSTETRVSFRYWRHRNFFHPYWLIIRIPSGAIRREILRLIRNTCKNN